MATRKAASTKKATAKKSAASANNKTTVRTIRADAKPERSTVRAVAKPAAKPIRPVEQPVKVAPPRPVGALLPANIINVVFAELVGTFLLTMVALATLKETMPLYVGLTLAGIIVATGAVSGGHVNPAVTFGLWAMRRLKTVLVPFYWGGTVPRCNACSNRCQPRHRQHA